MGSGQSRVSDSSDSSITTESEDSDDFHSVGSNIETMEGLSGLTYDAVNSTARPMFKDVTIDEILRLDNSLDDDDKISLVYLLYNNPNQALFILNQPLNNTVQEWYRKEAQNITKWNWKLLEALCITKNFKLLRQLGCSKNDACLTFLPLNKLTSLHINVIRKALYCLFEDLLPEHVDKLFDILQTDLKRFSINISLDKENLELTFLLLEKMEYFSLLDLTNLIQLFKRCDFLSLSEDFKLLQENVNLSTRHNQFTPFQSQSSNLSFMNDDVTQRNTMPIDHYHRVGDNSRSTANIPENVLTRETDECYHVDPRRPGLLLIIDNEHFYTEIRKELKPLLPALTTKLENRVGTKADTEHLKKVFGNLNFEIVVRNDKTHEELPIMIKECIKKVEENNYSSFFVAILSHGDKEVIYGCNTIPVRISLIQETLYCSSLAGKPKILLIQACQGDTRQRIDEEYATDGPEQQPPFKLTSPKTQDVLVFYATIPNYTAIRHMKKGTWFIQTLCEMMSSHTNLDFEEICRKVKLAVGRKRWGNVIMVPLTVSSLTKKLYLTPKNRQ